jgi:hypothetical protein
MARAHFWDAAIDRNGSAIQAEVSVYERGSTTLVAIYATESSNTVMPNPYQVNDGIVSHWADAGAYDVHIHDLSAPPRVDDRTVGWGAVPGVSGGIPGRMLEPQAVTGDKLADGAVGATKIAGGSISTVHLQNGSVTAEKVAADLATQAELDVVSGVASGKPDLGLVIAMGG